MVNLPLCSEFKATLPDRGRYAKSCVWRQLKTVHPTGFEPVTLGSEVRKGLEDAFTMLSQVAASVELTLLPRFHQTWIGCRFYELVGGLVGGLF